ncbi:MAG: ATP-binding cassette domain-containing protein, partial [Pseudobdellovibrionaceae bacterium]
MIHLSGITKQYGNKILYRNGSFQINSGERIGLVGPNGAGKTTIFRIIAGEEGVDQGSVAKPDKLVIGYFSQNIEDMSGRSALEEVKAAHPELPKLQSEMKVLEKQLEDSAIHPVSDDEMANILDRYGHVQVEFERLGG